MKRQAAFGAAWWAAHPDDAPQPEDAPDDGGAGWLYWAPLPSTRRPSKRLRRRTRRVARRASDPWQGWTVLGFTYDDDDDLDSEEADPTPV